jgi:hypothetical protein
MLSVEARLILIASRVSLDENAARELKALLSKPIDWPLVLRLAIPHGTLPLMARNLGEVASEQMPGDLLQQMTRYVDRLRARNERARADLIAVLTQLRQRGVEAVPFKGSILEDTIYRASAVREFADIDIMVKREKVAASIEGLHSMGYRLDPRQARRGLDHWLKRDEALEYTKAGFFTIDLHWRFSNKGFELLIHPALSEPMETVLIGGTEVSVYGPLATLMILCGHQARHQWRRLNWLCDIAAFVETCVYFDWDLALINARECRCERIVLTTLALSETLLGVCLPLAVIRRLDEEQRARTLARRLAPDILGSLPRRRRRRLFLQMREGNPVGVLGRYVSSKIAHRAAGLLEADADRRG